MHPLRTSHHITHTLSPKSIAGFRAVAEHLTPSALYEIAREIQFSTVDEDSKCAVLEVIVDIERGNNGLLALFTALAK